MGGPRLPTKGGPRHPTTTTCRKKITRQKVSQIANNTSHNNFEDIIGNIMLEYGLILHIFRDTEKKNRPSKSQSTFRQNSFFSTAPKRLLV